MIWVALLFTFSIVGYGIRQKVTRREWFVEVGLLVFTLIGSVLVSWGIWPKLDLLYWVRELFEPATKWLYSIL